MDKFGHMTEYNECFDCGKVEYLTTYEGELKFKVVPIEIEMPNRLKNITGHNIALCPSCFDMMNTADF